MGCWESKRVVPDFLHDLFEDPNWDPDGQIACLDFLSVDEIIPLFFVPIETQTSITSRYLIYVSVGIDTNLAVFRGPHSVLRHIWHRIRTALPPHQTRSIPHHFTTVIKYITPYDKECTSRLLHQILDWLGSDRFFTWWHGEDEPVYCGPVDPVSILVRENFEFSEVREEMDQMCKQMQIMSLLLCIEC